MSSHLLDIVYDKKNPPVAASITVNPQLKPFLVTSSKSLIWTERLESGAVWSVVRDPGDNIQADIVAAIVEKSHEESWGNLFHFNEDGILQALEYLKTSKFLDVEILVNPSSVELIPDTLELDEDLVVQEVSWMPLDCAVIVPTSREFVGNLIIFEKGPSCCVCVHNAKMGMAIAVKV